VAGKVNLHLDFALGFDDVGGRVQRDLLAEFLAREIAKQIVELGAQGERRAERKDFGTVTISIPTDNHVSFLQCVRQVGAVLFVTDLALGKPFQTSCQGSSKRQTSRSFIDVVIAY
jgi:hypothetical protein